MYVSRVYVSRRPTACRLRCHHKCSTSAYGVGSPSSGHGSPSAAVSEPPSAATAADSLAHASSRCMSGASASTWVVSFFSHAYMPFIIPRPHRVEILSDAARLTSVCLSRTSGLTREQRPRKTKIDTEVAHVTRDSDTTFKVK